MTNECAQLPNSVILIAGASSGMGRATALALAGSGARLVLASRNQSALDDLAQQITRAGSQALAFPTDFTDREGVGTLVQAVIAEYGQIDSVVTTAGTNIPRRTLDELTAESWADILSINLTAAFNVTQAVVPVMRDRGGLLIYVSSSAAKRPDASGVAYQSTKAGLVGLAHGTMEEERKHGIRTTVIFPGLTDTPMVEKRPTPTPPEVLARALKPEDIAAACLFVLRLPPRAHVPELLLYPSQL
jgi:NAD(P)-dependent dehydrogenase (short-subunit alcohol dehydrogenase family)